MQFAALNAATLAVSTIYVVYSNYRRTQQARRVEAAAKPENEGRERMLRERVAYMLWAAAMGSSA